MRLLLVLLAVAAIADARTRPLVHVPLEWKPTSALRLGAVQMPQTAIAFARFEDVRADKQAIGENREDKEPKPVTTSADVGAFVSTHMRELFDKAGLKTVDGGGDLTIKGEVTHFFARETSTYRAEVAVHIEVVGRDGTTRWSGTASGDARRFGRSYELEDYYEVLSDALVNTVSSLLQSADFQRALSASANRSGT